MVWDPRTYLQFGTERTRPVAELLARIDVATPKRLADLGCGPGNSTAPLAARWPDAQIEGIDSSAAMLADARHSGLPARWIEADIAHWIPDAAMDIIFSNAALQWVPGHETLLPRLISFLSPGGALAFQVPRNFEDPCHTLIHEVAAKGPWAHALKGVRDWWNVLSPEAYFEILEPHAASIDLWETRYLQVLNGKDAVFRWMNGTGLRPFAAALDSEDREGFLEAYRARVGDAYPMRSGGVTLYPFRRLFCVARK
jgi:trans-aconitate 2-methyltransferase